jgi:hypothetical protein
MPDAKITPVDGGQGQKANEAQAAQAAQAAQTTLDVEDPFDVSHDPRKRMSYGDAVLAENRAKMPFTVKVREFCEDPHSSLVATWFHLVYGLVIMVSVAAFCTETLNFKGKPIGDNFSVATYAVLEIVFTVIFVFDIVIRAAVAPRLCCCRCKSNGPFDRGAPVPFFLDIMVIFDVLSVLPLPVAALIQATGLDEIAPWLKSSVRVLSICRILRIFKVTRNFDGARVLFITAKNSIKPLTVSFIVLVSVMVIVSAVLFFVEPCYNNDCIFTDQMNAAYYLVITLTTIGYGDQIPVSVPGRTIGVLIAFLGSFYMAMPLAIIGAKFDEAFKERELVAVQKSRTRAHDLKEQLSHVSNRQRRGRVLRLGVKLLEILDTAISVSETENRFYMKSFPKKADILCNDVSFLFEFALGRAGDGDTPRVSILTRSDSVRELEKEKTKKQRRNTNLSITRSLMSDVNAIHDAKQSTSCRDRVWLCMNETGPMQSKASKWFRNVQLFIVALSIGIVALETLPELNRYGPGSRMCKQVVSHFCSEYVSTNDAEARRANPGCFPLRIEIDGTNHTYGGCQGGDVESCNFPDYKAGITCEHEAIVEEEESDVYVTLLGVPNGTKVTTKSEVITGVTYLQKTDGTAHSITVTEGMKVYSEDGSELLWTVNAWETLEAFTPGWDGLKVNKKSQNPPLTDMCHRTQCINNNILSTRDYPALFFYGEIFFIACFTLEIMVRAFVMRSCKTFFLNFANIIDMTAAGVALGEIVFIPMSWGEAKYEVWGMGSLADPAIFRVTRVLVAVRFISLQRQTGGLKVIGTTLYSTWRKLIIPSVFFFLFVLIFAGIYYTFESGALYACPQDRLDLLNDGFVHKDLIEPFLEDNKLIEENCRICVEEDQYNGGDQHGKQINEYNGDCKLLVLKGDDTMSMTAIEDMFDAMWVMIITMTTVGYGGKYPYTSSGKVVAIMSAILGSLYMAMPLTIVGNKFYDIYEQVEAQKSKAQLKSAQLSFELQKKKLEKKKLEKKKSMTQMEDGTRQTAMAFRLGHVVSLKRWVFRTKKKLEVQTLSEQECAVLRDYLKSCRKICRQTRFRRNELESFKSQHKSLMVIASKHFIHKHAEGIDTVESTLY